MPNDARASVVTSMFRSSPFLEEFCARMLKSLSAIIDLSWNFASSAVKDRSR